MDITTLFTPVATNLVAGIDDSVAIGLLVFGPLALLGIAIVVLRKFGVKGR